jgi:uncharacterized protein YbcI
LAINPLLTDHLTKIEENVIVTLFSREPIFRIKGILTMAIERFLLETATDEKYKVIYQRT